MAEQIYDINEIKKILPHRFPFLLIDRIVEVEENRCVGIKNFTANEPFSQEYFGGLYPMQGVLQVEAMAQVAAFLLLAKVAQPGDLAYFASIERVRFRRPALPGDQLRIEVIVDKLRSRAGRFIGCSFIDGKISCEARFTCMMAPKEG